MIQNTSHIIKVIVILLLVIPICTQEASGDADVNKDGIIDILDLTVVAKYIGSNLETIKEVNPDVNGDGVINILDLVYVVSMFGSVESQHQKTLIFGRGGDSVTLDPSRVLDGESAKVCDMIFDTLVQYKGETTDIEPALATSWENTLDGLTWMFNIRQDVKFHDGSQLNADTVVFSLLRPNVQTSSFLSDFVDSITTLDEFTVQIQLKSPYAPFLSFLASIENSIVSMAAVNRFGNDFAMNPVGTGPYKFDKWHKNGKIELTANSEHWTGKPSIDRFIFRSIPDNSKRLIELQKGNIHVMEFPNPIELIIILEDPNLRLYMKPSLNIGYLAMNLDKPPFDNLKVRLAINHAINKSKIVESLYRGTGIPAKNPIPPSLWGYDNSIIDYPYDPHHAKQLLAEAGFPDGFDTTLWALPIPRPYIPDGFAFAEEIKSDLSKIGIQAKIMSHDWQTYLDKIQNGEHEMAMFGWIASADPDNFFYYLLSQHTAEKPALNISFYRSDEMQELIDQARINISRAERIELYKKAQAIFHRDVPWVPLVHGQRLLVANHNVRNVKLSPSGWKYLRNLSFESN
ncbi:ABC transporter substrate-binding protein [Candidatus Poribacteria bacterium]|nr:ABC transporter substrate-binding protein [Candidatus Poribacteria bacterium]